MSMRRAAALATTALALGGALATNSTPSAAADTGRPLSSHGSPATAPGTRDLSLPGYAGQSIAVTLKEGSDRVGPAPQGVPAIAAAAKWHYKSVRATFCMLNKTPYWGGPKSTASCSVGYASLAGEVAYNGNYVWGQWIDCQHKAIRHTKVTIDWCGYWNNGGRGGGVRYMDLGLNGTVDSPAVNNTFWIRIDAYRTGKLALRGGSSWH